MKQLAHCRRLIVGLTAAALVAACSTSGPLQSGETTQASSFACTTGQAGG